MSTRPRRTRGGGEVETTRREEELEVGKQLAPLGNVHVQKRVEAEQVEQDVPRRVERPVVQKQTVAKERVGIETDVTTDRQTIEDEVRKERVDVEGDVER